MSYSGEVLLGVTSTEGSTLFRRGERIAQLIPMAQYHVNLNQIDASQFVDSGRGGFGSTNVTEIKTT